MGTHFITNGITLGLTMIRVIITTVTTVTTTTALTLHKQPNKILAICSFLIVVTDFCKIKVYIMSS